MDERRQCPRCGTVFHSRIKVCWVCQGGSIGGYGERALAQVYLGRGRKTELDWGRHFVGRWVVEPDICTAESVIMSLDFNTTATNYQMWDEATPWSETEHILYGIRKLEKHMEKFPRLNKRFWILAGENAYYKLNANTLPEWLYLVRRPELAPDEVMLMDESMWRHRLN